MKKIGREITDNKSKGEQHEFTCMWCNNNTTSHTILTSIDEEGMDYLDKERFGTNLEYNWHDIYQIIKCDGCRKISFRRYERNTEEYEPVETFFPENREVLHKIKSFHRLPNKLNRIYAESGKSLNEGNTILATAGIRAMVECLCDIHEIKSGKVHAKDDKGILLFETDGTPKMKTSKRLEGKIEGLCEKGIISKRNAGTLQEIRFLGNGAIHKMDVLTEDDLLSGMDAIEKTLMSIYDVNRIGEDLKDKRLRKASESGTT